MIAQKGNILSYCYWIRIHKHLLRKGTLNHSEKLAKWNYSYGVLNVCYCYVKHLHWVDLIFEVATTFSNKKFLDQHICHGKNTQALRHRNMFAQYRSVILQVWWHGRVTFYKPSGCGFDFSSSKLKFRYRPWSKQEVVWSSDNIKVKIRSVYVCDTTEYSSKSMKLIKKLLVLQNREFKLKKSMVFMPPIFQLLCMTRGNEN